MPGRIVILSDLHFGRPHGAVAGADLLRAVWAGAEHLVINGDVGEIHHPRHRIAAVRETLRLVDLCEADGVEVTLLSGNHDPYITDRRHLLLGGDSVFVTHGDVLHPAIAPWSPASARIHAAHDAALACLEPEDRGSLEARLAASQHASYAEWENIARLEKDERRSGFLLLLTRPWVAVDVLRYWHVFPRLAAEFVESHAPGARFAVLGHTHHPGIWNVGERIIINTGSYGFPGRPYAVILEEDTLSVVRIVRHEGVYALEAEPLRRFTLAAVDSSRKQEQPQAAKTEADRSSPSPAPHRR